MHSHQSHYSNIRSLAAEFSLGQSNVSKILQELRDYVYLVDPYLIQCRNLDDDRYLHTTIKSS